MCDTYPRFRQRGWAKTNGHSQPFERLAQLVGSLIPISEVRARNHVGRLTWFSLFRKSEIFVIQKNSKFLARIFAEHKAQRGQKGFDLILEKWSCMSEIFYGVGDTLQAWGTLLGNEETNNCGRTNLSYLSKIFRYPAHKICCQLGTVHKIRLIFKSYYVENWRNQNFLC